MVNYVREGQVKVWHFYENLWLVKGQVTILRSVGLVITLRIAQAEDKATQRCDLSAALGPKSKRGGWKRFPAVVV